jgi:large subunit ribosomal protein L2
MGKRIIQQARGKGGPRYKSTSFNFAGDTRLKSLHKDTIKGKVVELLHSRGHTAPLARMQYDDGELSLVPAPEGIKIGEEISCGTEANVTPGNTLPLHKLPEGTIIYNIEKTPGDGGKFCKSSGTGAKIVSKLPKGIVVILPSKKKKVFHNNCRATIGIVAGGGRTEKPILKAGKMHHKRKATNRLYPRISANAQNAVDHPFGNSRSARKAKNKGVSRHAPPGRKVGHLAPRRTGKRK